MIINEHYETDVKYVVGQSHVVLHMLGIWPSTNRQPNTTEKIINIMYGEAAGNYVRIRDPN